MEKPLLTLSSKDFQSGISQMGAHSDRGGLFYKAAGVTPLFGAGSSQDVNNGLLMAGAGAGTASYGSVTGNIINAIPYAGTAIANCNALFATSAHKIARLEFSGGLPSGSLSTLFTATATLTGGLAVKTTAAGLNYILYRRHAHIGRYETGGPTQDDTWQATTTDYWGAWYDHYLLNKIFFGNGPGKIGSIDSALTVNTSALTFDNDSYASAISDDGAFVVIAITRNNSADTTLLADSHILYWDGSRTTGFLKEFPVPDPYIYSLQKTPFGLYAFGVTGIWHVTFDGITKIFNHNPGIYTASGASAIHYGKGATSFFSNALIWGGQVGSTTTRALKSLGKLDSAALSAYLQPVLLTSSVNITFVHGQLLKGLVFVADDTPQLYPYLIGSGTPTENQVSAQTIYFPVGQPVDISHIDVVFGEPLASGDTLDLDVFRDQDNSAADFGAVSYNSSKTTRRYQFRPTTGLLSVDDQFSILLTFTSGAVKIKKIEVFGQPRARVNV